MNFVKYQILFDNFDSKTYIFVQFDFLSVFRVTDSLINFRTSLQPGVGNVDVAEQEGEGALTESFLGCVDQVQESVLVHLRSV